MSVTAVAPWAEFADFIRWERAVGGPDPHMAVVGAMSREAPWAERVWRAGCYIGVYNVPTAEVLWRHWPWPRVREEGDALEPWLREHWAGIATRRERRAVRTPEKLARYLRSYAAWAEALPGKGWYGGDYDAAWADCQTVYGLGRYVALKLLEFFRRYCEAPLYLRDIRARGGWSPRRALALLYPERAEALNGDDSRSNVTVSEWAAEQARATLYGEFGLDLDYYNLQVCLCDFKQSYVGKRQFPGRSQDSEIMYHDKIAPVWGSETALFETRARIFPRAALGEVNGWRHVREELGDVLADHGYTWSDLLYDYGATDDVARPARRPEPLAGLTLEEAARL